MAACREGELAPEPVCGSQFKDRALKTPHFAAHPRGAMAQVRELVYAVLIAFRVVLVPDVENTDMRRELSREPDCEGRCEGVVHVERMDVRCPPDN